MLTGKMVRVRFSRGHVIPYYLDVDDAQWREMADRLLGIFRAHLQRTRGELEAEVREIFGDTPNQLVHQGLAKLLEDRCEFAVASGLPPENVRAAVFAAAARRRRELGTGNRELACPDSRFPVPDSRFDRRAVLTEVAAQLATTPEDIERALFADLRSEQQLVAFRDITAERLLQRYNVALAQAALLRATAVQVKVRGEPPRRYRQLLRLVKFHRLLCEIEPLAEDVYLLRLDGPLSLFSSTQKYGLQLALFLPAILQCGDFELEASLLWGPQRRPMKFRLTSRDGLVSHYADRGMYVPPELAMFVELFRNRVTGWEIAEETELLPLGNSFWAPDYQLIHTASGQVVYLEVLGFWRRSSLEKHLERLRAHASVPFVLAVSQSLHVDDSEVEGLPAAVYHFRQMPLPQEVVKAAESLLRR